MKPGGEVRVSKMCRSGGAWIAECLGWTVARRAIGTVIVLLFRPPQAYEALGRHAFGDALPQPQIFPLPGSAQFTPTTSMPRLAWPRFAHRFDVCLFCWPLKNAA